MEKEDPSWILEYSKQTGALTVQDLQQTAKKYFNMNNYIKAVLTPEK
jgi:zinc protease